MVLTAIEFIAQSINRKVTTEKGFKNCSHWGTLDEKLKKRYIKQAKEMVKKWADVEIKVEENRKRLLNDLMKK